MDWPIIPLTLCPAVHLILADAAPPPPAAGPTLTVITLAKARRLGLLNTDTRATSRAVGA